MKIFVTGATGFVGTEVLRQLRADGHSIRLLATDPNSTRTRKVAAEFRAEIHQGDLQDVSSLASGLKGADAVIHLVGIISEVGDNTFEKVHAGGTQNMVMAAQQAGIKRFIHMSALGTRLNAVARYHQSKWRAEEIVRASGLDFTIFRPSIIYGQRDHFVNLFAGVSRWLPALPVMGSGEAKLQPVPVADVARSFVHAVNEAKSIGQTYDLCGPTPLSFNEVLKTIFKVTHRKRGLIHIPLPIARVQATLLELIFAKILRQPAPLTRDQLLMLQEDNVGNPQPANELFGLKPVPFDDGIAAYLSNQ